MPLYVNGSDEQTLNLWILVRVQAGALSFYGDPPPLASKTKAGDKPNAGFVGCSSKLQS